MEAVGPGDAGATASRIVLIAKGAKRACRRLPTAQRIPGVGQGLGAGEVVRVRPRLS
jgi:hypothetical protein